MFPFFPLILSKSRGFLAKRLTNLLNMRGVPFSPEMVQRRVSTDKHLPEARKLYHVFLSYSSFVLLSVENLNISGKPCNLFTRNENGCSFKLDYIAW